MERQRTSNRMDCLIIGGGICGMLTAWYLQAAGLKVALVERGAVGQESSWAGGGILSPLYPWQAPEAVTALVSWSQAHYPDFIAGLTEHTGIDSEYIRNGLLILDTNEYAQAQAWAARQQLILEKLENTSLHVCEPELGNYAEGLWLPQISQVRNPLLLNALKQALISAGVPLLEHHLVLTLRRNLQGKLLGIETDKGIFNADKVIVTAGAWSANLLDVLGTPIAVYPVRGQMILFTTQPGLISRIILSNGHYVIPRRDGSVLVGSSLEHVGFNKNTTPAALSDMKYTAFDLVPRLADYPVARQWAGLRPSSPGGIPFIGEHHALPSLYVNIGHFRNGFAMGLASAHLLADIILGRPPIVDPTPYAITAERTISD